MKLGRIVVLLMYGVLAGCGVETMGAAATSASARKQELERAQKAEQEARQMVDRAMQLQQERVQAAD